ncbi:hypothetical protein K474DRAFT_1665397 [Panus rudis PR-1116 ss-1]|nr:hypothetical protein K474DRAFT_1665397 [Panus rudis PR-1116 ss-1]
MATTPLGLLVLRGLLRVIPDCVKISSYPNTNEVAALRFVESLRGINAPYLIDYASTPSRSYTLMTWINGDCCALVWDELTQSDRDRLLSELRAQFSSMREQTLNKSSVICNAQGSPISDPRIPWVQEENPCVFSSPPEFFRQVWIGLDRPRLSQTIRPLIEPLIERSHIPIVFCHGDLGPKNIIIPGGLERWRVGSTAVYLIDWEFAGWMPLSWEALKATFLVVDLEEDEIWYGMMKALFPESVPELEADWLWRSKSNITIL